MIPQHLIESALALCSKTMEDMESLLPAIWNEELGEMNDCTVEFSIEKFCYYLFNDEFTQKYWEKIGMPNRYRVNERFGKAIYEYQLGNEQPLISLLEKI